MVTLIYFLVVHPALTPLRESLRGGRECVCEEGDYEFSAHLELTNVLTEWMPSMGRLLSVQRGHLAAMTAARERLDCRETRRDAAAGRRSEHGTVSAGRRERLVGYNVQQQRACEFKGC